MIKKLIIFPLLIASAQAFSGVKEQCKTLESCVNAVSGITGDQYLFGDKLNGTITATDNIELNQDNVDILLSEILELNGYARLRVTKGVYKIISARDVRYNPTPRVASDKKHPPQLPDNLDWYMMSYQFSNTGLKLGHSVSRSLRPFMSRYGRIIDFKDDDRILIHDTARNLKRMYGLIQEIDKKPTKQKLKEIVEDRKYYQKLQLEKAKNCIPDKK